MATQSNIDHTPAGPDPLPRPGSGAHETGMRSDADVPQQRAGTSELAPEAFRPFLFGI